MPSYRTLALLATLLAVVATLARSQELIDRIVGRVENDIILQSQVRELGRYQALVEGKAESDAQILDRLVDQWIVRNEADNARFPHPMETDIARGVERVQDSFASPGEYAARKKELGLSDAEIHSMVASQLYLSNYLDSRFRPGVQVEPSEVQDFYEKAVIPRAKARNQAPPSLDASREYIHEALVQRAINDQAERWLKESRVRLSIRTFLDDGAK
jgi:hypothetical protein